MQAGIRFAGLGLPGACLLLFALVDCGAVDDDSRSTGGQGFSGASVGGSGGVSGGAGHAPSACESPIAAGYEPIWTPPSAPLAAGCTEQQVAQKFALCGGSTFNQVACRAFDVDPANSACLGCLFGALGDPSIGAVLVLPSGQWIANRAGCIALVDGDSSASGCGARAQASDVCEYTACLAACTLAAPEADFLKCEQAARSGPCSLYFNKAACVQLPRYASCAYADFGAYYQAMADLFCVTGSPGSTPEGGAAGAGP